MDKDLKQLWEKGRDIVENGFNRAMTIHYKSGLDYDAAVKRSAEMVLSLYSDPDLKPIAEYVIEKKLQELEPDYSTSKGSN